MVTGEWKASRLRTNRNNTTVNRNQNDYYYYKRLYRTKIMENYLLDGVS